jgi:hypothetical protein
MSADDTGTIKWHVHAAFAVHKDMKTHTVATMTFSSVTISAPWKHCRDSKKWDSNLARAPQLAVQLERGG